MASRGADFWAEYQPVCRQYYGDGLTGRDLARWQRARLRAVLEHVTSRSAFYRRHLAGLDLHSVTPRSLPSLPFTTKADLQRAGHDVLCGTAADALVFYETTGTTGVPTPAPRDARDVASSNVHVAESWRRTFRHHFGARMPVVGLMGPCELYAFGDTFGDVAGRLGACHAKIWPASPRVGFATALRLMRELHVEVVVCSPALCLTLARMAARHGYDPRRDFAVRLFLVLGEICTPGFAANAASVWDATLRPTLYGSQEALAIATGCPQGALHISGPNYLVEIIDPDTGASLGGHGQGELCLTMLVDGIKPLIRYRTGDLVRVRPAGCPCGAPGDIVEVAGRVDDRVDLGGQLISPAALESAILDGVRGCLGYQVVLARDPSGQDEVAVRLELTARVAPDSGRICQGVAQRVSERFGVTATCAAVPELDPVTGIGAQVSWKAARVLDTREPATAGRPA